jgi:hypothetical protein
MSLMLISDTLSRQPTDVLAPSNFFTCFCLRLYTLAVYKCIHFAEKEFEMSVLVLDAGNSIIKAKIARRENGEIAFQHALRQLTENEYQRILSRVKINGSSTDYVRVNGLPYVVGESAERHGILTQRSGAARYTKYYYGVLAAIALVKLYGRGREVAALAVMLQEM